MHEFKYAGSELELFKNVHNWKSYWSSRLRPFITGDVAEVGAGIGANTPYLKQSGHNRWICIEPDPELVRELTENVSRNPVLSQCEMVNGTLESLKGENFDTILYIDVLEHIEDDANELRTAATLLRFGGRVVVLSPAHQSLYTAFDAAIGHFRRYNRASLRKISPPDLRLETMFYLDSAGLLLSAANRVILRQAMPTERQLMVWDTRVVPVSRILDKFLFGHAGKSIVGVWIKKS